MSTPSLYQRFPELRASLPRLPLGTAPTPVRELTALSGRTPVWLKDDGAFGDGGWGGNKVRKLEWLLAEAVRREKRTVLTFGALGTNWGLATARYARDHGLDTALALVDQPLDDHVRAQLERLRESGARLYFTHTKARTYAAAPYLMLRHRPSYLVPPGGSNEFGVLGYVEAAFEIAAQIEAGQLPRPGRVVVPVGSGGTAAGLWLGLELAGLGDVTVVAVVVNDTLRLDHRSLGALAGRCVRLLRARGAVFSAPALRPDRLFVTREWLGPGYGYSTPEGAAALRTAREQERLTLEPVYTGKAMAATLDLASSSAEDERPVLFVNTNGPR